MAAASPTGGKIFELWSRPTELLGLASGTTIDVSVLQVPLPVDLEAMNRWFDWSWGDGTPNTLLPAIIPNGCSHTYVNPTDSLVEYPLKCVISTLDGKELGTVSAWVTVKPGP